MIDFLRWVSRAVFGSFRPPAEKTLTVNLILGVLALVTAALALAHDDFVGAVVLALAGTVLFGGAPLVHAQPALLGRVLSSQGLATAVLAVLLAVGSFQVVIARMYGGNPSFRYLPGLTLVPLLWAAVQLDTARRAALVFGVLVEVVRLVLLLSTL